MSATTQKITRKLTSLELSAPARGALRRLSKLQGWTKTKTVETALLQLERDKLAPAAFAPGGAR